MSLLYDGYIQRLSDRFAEAIGRIEAVHNFELGSEFEVAICEVLQDALPERYGICRGYLVDRDGKKAGDDIIIYEKGRFPSLRALGDRRFERKEQIPIEAAYAYIEAKHTLQIEGTGEGTITKAVSQVANVKRLVRTRPTVNPGVSHNVKLGRGFEVKVEESWPQILNPFYDMVLGRRVRRAAGEAILTDVRQIDEAVERLKFDDDQLPDCVVAGSGNIILPFWEQPTNTFAFRSPFHLEKSRFFSLECENRAFGVALAALLFALSWIRLGEMPWTAIIENGVDLAGTVAKRTAKSHDEGKST